MKIIARALRQISIVILIVFILPAAIASGWWALQDRPTSWRTANWNSAGTLPEPSANRDAVIYIMAARTGGMKGALSEHSWIVLKEKNSDSYDRYDKVGWGSPVRKNAYAADANWYSNPPYILRAIKGKSAENLMPKITAAIANYPFAHRGGYKIWPGPNSNSFIAHILNSVPQIGISPSPLAVGRSFHSNGKLMMLDPDWSNVQVNWRGLIGFAFGKRHGFEVSLAGLVAGVEFTNPAIKLPGVGAIRFGDQAMAENTEQSD